MKKETKRKIVNFTTNIIDTFLGIPETLICSFDRKNFYYLMTNNFPEKQLTVDNICHWIHNLKKRGYIRIEKTNNTESIVFTDKAKLIVVDKLINKSPRNDYWHFVSFDIPERKRLGRDQFRRTIKRMGFKQIQKSLWVSDKNVGEYIEMASLEFGVSEYVVYLVTNKTNIDAHIKLVLTPPNSSEPN